jgi:hypothetical protein
MPVRHFAPPRLAALAAVLALAACSSGQEENLADLGNEVDPQIAGALNDQILVDPNLANQSNRTAVRPPATPTQAQYPDNNRPTAPGGARVQNASQTLTGTGCADPAGFDYNRNWASRLPAAFPLYPGAQVSDAAGNDRPDCRARAVTFATGDNFQRVLDWYHTRAVRAGYSSEHQLRQGDHILAGTNQADGGAFYLIVTPKGNGAEAALIATRGR